MICGVSPKPRKASGLDGEITTFNFDWGLVLGEVIPLANYFVCTSLASKGSDLETSRGTVSETSNLIHE